MYCKLVTLVSGIGTGTAAGYVLGQVIGADTPMRIALITGAVSCVALLAARVKQSGESG